MELVANDPAVVEFVRDRLGMGERGLVKSIGLKDGNSVVAGFIYEDFNGRNCFIHMAATHGKLWLTRRALFHFFAYPFITCGLARVTGWVEASNLASRNLCERFGCHLEATLKGCARDGGDVLIYVLWKHDCRFIGGKYARNV